LDFSITFRPIEDRDSQFLYDVYVSTREDELSATGWPESQKQAFLKLQFAAQHTYYTQTFTNARFNVILKNSQPIGRLYLDERDDEIRIIDIALLPGSRGQGIGSGILRDILADAAGKTKCVRIHVEQYNPAMRLYQRLGFRKTDLHGVYHLMEWQPHAGDGVRT
jgi:ribosomal protein S18 acetylase RimI-like enzyme